MDKLLIISLFLLIVTTYHFAQTDWVKWEAKEISYKVEERNESDNDSVKKNFVSNIFSFLRDIYGFFISDLDGDNCPFYPSCSNFFVQSVGEVGLIKGSLMFSDRFLRDLNLFKGGNKYVVYKTGKFYDPPLNYTLSIEKIKFLVAERVLD